jgi:hypothetical protein
VFGIEARELLAVSRSAQPQHIQHVYELLGGPTAGRCMRHASAAYVSACMQLRQRSRTAGGPNGRALYAACVSSIRQQHTSAFTNCWGAQRPGLRPHSLA